MTSTSNDKMLRVLSLLLRKGKISPSTACEQEGLSRTAVHRALTALEESHIVRKTLDNSEYRLSEKFIKMVGLHGVFQAEITDYLPRVRELCKVEDLHCTIYGISENSLIKALESTSKSLDIDDVEDGLPREVILALCAAVTRSDLARLIRANYPELDRQSLHNVHNWIMIQIDRNQDNVFWAPDKFSLATTLKVPSGSPFCFYFWHRPHRTTHPEKLKRALAGLFEIAPPRRGSKAAR